HKPRRGEIAAANGVVMQHRRPCDLAGRRFFYEAISYSLEPGYFELVLSNTSDADLGFEVLPECRIGGIETGIQINFEDIPGPDKRHLINFLHAPRSTSHYHNLIGERNCLHQVVRNEQHGALLFAP